MEIVHHQNTQDLLTPIIILFQQLQDVEGHNNKLAVFLVKSSHLCKAHVPDERYLTIIKI